jgi:crotonobetainyl-CoA:carnitine CoA-transferase CaiB-like acyl-CoA transferase
VPDFARGFRLHLSHGQVLDGAAFPSGRCLVIDDPEFGLASAAASEEELLRGYPDARIEWPDTIRAEAFREAASEIEARQAARDTEERARFGNLDHESVLQGAAVRDTAAHLRARADGIAPPASPVLTFNRVLTAEEYQEIKTRWIREHGGRPTTVLAQSGPAEQCRAEHHGDQPPSRCIRPARHLEPDHADGGAFHWLERHAVYPTTEERS